MSEQFQALPITPQGARAAYPLVYLHDPSISLEEWLRFARRRAGSKPERGGLIAIRDCRGIIHSVFSYQVDIDLRAHKRLCINHLLVAHLPGALIEDAITKSIADMSAAFGCQTVGIMQPYQASRPRCATAALLRSRMRVISSARPH